MAAFGFVPLVAQSADAAAHYVNANPAEWSCTSIGKDDQQSTTDASSMSDDCDVVGRVWRLSQELQGCRKIQLAFDDAESDAERLQLAEEMKGHAWVAARHPHANHVLQKMIVSMKPDALQFVVDAICPKNRVVQAARHKYGCRVLQRLFEHCRPDQMAPIMEVLVANVKDLSKDAFGNYVIQHLIEHGAPSYQRAIMESLASNVRRLGTNPNGAAVITKALTCCELEEDQVLLAKAIVAEDGLLTWMARTRHGSPAVKSVLDVLEGSDREAACKQLSEDDSALSSRYGRKIAKAIDDSGNA
jgi:pumilio RNA-binding family